MPSAHKRIVTHYTRSDAASALRQQWQGIEAIFFFLTANECVSEEGKVLCKSLGGECVTLKDGYYTVTAICVAFGVIFLVAFIIPTARKLQGSFVIHF